MIGSIVWLGLAAAGSALLIANAALLMQALAVTLMKARPESNEGERPACIVLVPAHNEAGGIVRTVRGLMAELAPDDRVLVIADNCTDATASLAAAAGAQVLTRTDTQYRGKGHALSAGLRHIHADPLLQRPVVVFVDADCRFGAGGLGTLVRACQAHDAPVQCRNLMVRARHQAGQTRLGEFASRIRNDFRPAGYARLGLPGQLFGTGMAMPARLATAERFATGHVAEDLLIGVEAALAGAPPRYVREASLYSHFPDTAKGVQQQKNRWVHGHLAVIISHAPRLLGLGLWRRDRDLLALGADLLTPPLTLLAGGHMALVLVATAFLALTGATLPLALAMAGLAIFSFAMLAGWRFCGRGLIGWREITQAPRHAVQVAVAALAFAAGRRSAWTRADRTRLP